MKQVERISETCKITQSNNGKVVEGVVYEFKENKSLIVVLNKSVKLTLNWNGRIFEGRMAGIDFTSPGPEVKKSVIGGR